MGVCVQVRGKPSASASKEMNSQEKARLTLQQSSLGKEALKRKEEELEEAMEMNEVVCRSVCSLLFSITALTHSHSRSLLPQNSSAV